MPTSTVTPTATIDLAIADIDYRSIASAGSGLRALHLDRAELGGAVADALALSPTRAHRLVRGMISTAADIDQTADEMTALVEWSAREGVDERKVVIDAMRTSGGDVMLIDRLARLPRTEARPFMAEFLESGGRKLDIAHWLAAVGGVFREHGTPQPGVSGGVIDWIVDTAEDAIDALGEAVEAVVDAIIAAGESIADVISEIITFTAEQMANLVEALMQAGQTIGGLIVDAVEAGVAIVTKTVRALIDIGRTVAEVIGTVLTEAAGAIIDTLNALRAIGESFIDIIAAAVTLAASAFGQVVQALLDIGRSVVTILGDALAAAVSVLASTVQALLDIGRSIATLITDVITGRASLLDALTRALRDIGQSVVTLLDEAATAVAGAVRSIAASLARIGTTIVDLAEWAADAAIDFSRQVIGALVDVGNTVVDLVTSLAQRALRVMTAVIDGLYAMGQTFAGLVADLAGIALDLMSKFLEAAFALGTTIIEFVGATIATTYDLAKDLIEAALDAGATLADLLLEAATGTYFVLRRMVFGVLDAVGLGEVMRWALGQLEAGVTAVFREVVLALRFAGQQLTAVLDWAEDQTAQAFDAVVDAWESVGEDLVDLYEWASTLALDRALAVWERIGAATLRLHNSVSYVLNYLENDFLPGARRFVRGLMAAGYVLADLMARVLSRSVEFVADVVLELLDLGVTLVDLLVDVATDPGSAMDRLLEGLIEAGQTWEAIMTAAEAAGDDIAAEVAASVGRLEGPLREMLDAAWEIGGGLLGLVIAQLLNSLATYRLLTDTEKTEATRVFGSSIDLDLVSISQESLDNTIIFEVQALFQRLGGDAANARAFVTGTLINMKAGEGISIETLIHELTHVWQNFETGPMYLVEAIHAQTTPDSYNYGYDNDTTGEGAQDELIAANGNFEAFNREQQGDIMEHFYRREFVDLLDATEWEPYVAVVRAA
jgi:hypothetical protein